MASIRSGGLQLELLQYMWPLSKINPLKCFMFGQKNVQNVFRKISCLRSARKKGKKGCMWAHLGATPYILKSAWLPDKKRYLHINLVGDLDARTVVFDRFWHKFLLSKCVVPIPCHGDSGLWACLQSPLIFLLLIVWAHHRRSDYHRNNMHTPLPGSQLPSTGHAMCGDQKMKRILMALSVLGCLGFLLLPD